MATALDVIRRAMRLIGALAEGEVPTAAQSSDGLEAFQAMLGEWETRGVRLGRAVDETYIGASEIFVPVTHLNALAFNLAVVIAPEYGAADRLSAVLPQAERSFKMLQAQYAKVPVISPDPAVVSQRGILGNVWWGWDYNSGDAIDSDAGPITP